MGSVSEAKIEKEMSEYNKDFALFLDRLTGEMIDQLNSLKEPQKSWRLDELYHEWKNEHKEKIKSLRELLDKGIPEIKWRVENILPKQGITILGGTAGSMKSWAGMQLALACSTGTDFLCQFECEKGRVLYIDEENGNVTLPFRFDKLVKGHELNEHPLDNIFISIFNNVTLDNPQGRAYLKELITKYRPEVVIIDSMVRCMTGDENKAEDVKKVYETLKEHCGKGIAFVILHHTTKANNGGMTGLRGSGDFAAFADAVLMFAPGREGFCNVTAVKNRHVAIEELGEFFFKLEVGVGENIKLEWKGLRDSSGDVVQRCAEELWRWISDNELVGFVSLDAIKLTHSKNYSKNACFSALRRLVEADKIIKLKRGEYRVPKDRHDVEEMKIV